MCGGVSTSKRMLFTVSVTTVMLANGYAIASSHLAYTSSVRFIGISMLLLLATAK